MYQRQLGETCCTCGRVLQGITQKVKKQAEQRINSRFIMYVLVIHNLALKNTYTGRHHGNSAESQELKRARVYLLESFTKKHPCACTNNDTQSGMEEFDRTANEKRNYVASSADRAHYRDQLERTHIPHGQLFQLSINPREWYMGRRIESQKHKTSLFLLTSESARFIIETADERLDRTNS